MFCNRNRQAQKVKTQSDMKSWKRFCLQQHENRGLCDIRTKFTVEQIFRNCEETLTTALSTIS